MAKKSKVKKKTSISKMTTDQLRRHITSEEKRANQLGAVDEDLGHGWKRAAESIRRGVAEAEDRLAELEG